MKITLMIVVLFFVLEYILLPELASARREFHQIGHLNFLWLILGVVLELGALLAYAEVTRTVLSPDAPSRFRIFRINMSALAVSHTLPGGTVPGTAASYRLLTESNVPGSTAAFGLAAQGMGSAVVLNLIFWLALLISIPLQGYNPAYGFGALLGVLFLGIFAGLVLLLTRGERQAS
ncbi:MAG TPA: lysylphosphatidylglycerol synthase domain-containing protein, partial [Acidimicrobiales bacterium]|nr:lysylphosphatidylglycerol synthase domain-containing protein [Acidimicrobiales bacterium]